VAGQSHSEDLTYRASARCFAPMARGIEYSACGCGVASIFITPSPSMMVLWIPRLISSTPTSSTRRASMRAWSAEMRWTYVEVDGPGDLQAHHQFRRTDVGCSSGLRAIRNETYGALRIFAFRSCASRSSRTVICEMGVCRGLGGARKPGGTLLVDCRRRVGEVGEPARLLRGDVDICRPTPFVGGEEDIGWCMVHGWVAGGRGVK
jgi:hypothetical protein